jgi:dephospho-CoA kinase
MTSTTIRVGLTGGIGSGKSTFAKILGELGAVVIDADAISRSLTAPGGAAIAAISNQFGTQLITAEGSLDRHRMRELVFDNPSAKHQLESIIHPLVGLRTEQQARAVEDKGNPCIIFDLPLLVESGHWRRRLHRVIVLDCPERTQIDRVMTRNGFSCADVEKIIAAQASRLKRLAAADIVIYNHGSSLDDLREEARQLAERFGLCQTIGIKQRDPVRIPL